MWQTSGVTWWMIMYRLHTCTTSTAINDCFVMTFQGCPQDVKLQDRDETEMLNPQERDETETFNLQDRDETRRSKKRIETAVSQFKNTNWWSLSLHKLFLRVRSIIFFTIYPQAWCIACMFTRLKSRDRDRDVISSRPRRDRDVQDRDYIPVTFTTITTYSDKRW